MNKYPNNPHCKRPKDSVMREYCRCIDCKKYEKEKANEIPKAKKKVKSTYRDLW